MIVKFSGRYQNGQIECDEDAKTISSSVHSNGVVILKNIFEKDSLNNLRQMVFDWSSMTEPEISSENTFHRIDHLPPMSKTPRIFHAYNFVLREGAIDIKLDKIIRPFFTAMKHLQNALTGNNADFTLGKDGRFLKPQILQYPSGGGFFDRHCHPYEPQRIGMIVGLSQQGTDFTTGGTWFEIDGVHISIEKHLQLGDIALFKYDIPHGISVVDADEELDWGSPRGRWTMVLPYS